MKTNDRKLTKRNNLLAITLAILLCGFSAFAQIGSSAQRNKSGQTTQSHQGTNSNSGSSSGQPAGSQSPKAQGSTPAGFPNSTNSNSIGGTLSNGTTAAGDTATYVFYNDEMSFDSKRTIVINDKHKVDSLINALAADATKRYKVIHQKEGKQAAVVNQKFLKALDKTGAYRLTIAYNKPNLDDDFKPIYIIKSR